VPAPQESESRGEGGDREQPQTGSERPSEVPGVWLPFGLFVLGFAILVTESKFTLPAAEDYALKGLGGAICLLTVVWIRRQARKSGPAIRAKKNE
jgi:hypothetical protein